MPTAFVRGHAVALFELLGGAQADGFGDACLLTQVLRFGLPRNPERRRFSFLPRTLPER